ncbi:MAG: beta-galactosidase [candidate division Zixibacteria bacterium]|jgi:beta-galactosidase|nr:beta-galactosidase [candidate division Zixibacteria bacterium]
MVSYSKNNFVIGKEEYAPFAAEMHYFRIQKRYWSICFERIRKAGFRIISTVVPWNLHEDDSRDFDFSGYSDPTRDLIVFVELVREFGFKLILRPGPWLFSELYLNGLPKFLEKYPEIFARTKDGDMIRSTNRADISASYYPSIGNPRYMNFVRHYLNGLTEIIKNYVYPRGPLFLLELDYDNYFGGHFDPHLTDYNEYVVKEIYPVWLQEKYGEIKYLNKVYSTKYKDFQSVEPPAEFSSSAHKQKASFFDWFRFKEYLADNYLTELREMYKTFSCEPMFFRTLSFKDSIQSSLSSNHGPVEGCMSCASLSWDLSTSENLSRVRYLRTISDFPYLAELPVGNWSYNPERSNQYYPIGADATRYMITVGLAGGLKGFTYNMFAEREHWYGSALGEDGTIQESYEMLKTFNINAQTNDICSFDPVDSVGIATYKPYAWESLINDGADKANLPRYLATKTMPKLGKDLDMLKYDYAIPDLSSPSAMEKFKTLIIPVSDMMDENEQNFIIEMAKSKKDIILVGTLPQYNTSMQSCTVLASALKCKTTKEFKLGHVKAKGQEFTTVVFGGLKTTDKLTRRLATAGRKTVALLFHRYQGKIILISFDLCTELNHHKMEFLEQILKECKLDRYVETSNPNIRAIVRKGEKNILLCLLNSTPQLPFKEGQAGSTRTSVKIDLRKLGFKSARVQMTELFSNEVINTTALELSVGLYLTMSQFDGRSYLITRR